MSDATASAASEAGGAYETAPQGSILSEPRPEDPWLREEWDRKDQDRRAKPRQFPVWNDWILRTEGTTTYFKRIVIVDTSDVDPSMATILTSIANKLTKSYRKADSRAKLSPEQLVAQTHIERGFRELTQGQTTPRKSHETTTTGAWTSELRAHGLGDQWAARPALIQEIRDVFSLKGQLGQPEEGGPFFPRLCVANVLLKEDNLKKTAFSKYLPLTKEDAQKHWSSVKKWTYKKDTFESLLDSAKIATTLAEAIEESTSGC